MAKIKIISGKNLEITEALRNYVRKRSKRQIPQ